LSAATLGATPSIGAATLLTPDDDLARAIARAAAHLRLRLPPSARPEQGTRILDGLARLLPYSGASMSQLISAEQSRLPNGATVVYIGAEAVVDVPTLVALRQLRAHGYAVSLLLMTADPRPDTNDTTNANTSATENGAILTTGERDATPSADERAEQASAHDLHLANLPITYIGGRARWRALVAAALGPDAQRRASQPISPQRRAAERALARAYAANPYLSPTTSTSPTSATASDDATTDATPDAPEDATHEEAAV
jgi:hypothetical protein